MTNTIITVTPKQTIKECMVIFTEKHIHHLLVMENEKLVGLISVGDVVKDVIDELEFLVKQLTGYIKGLH
jgi:CBS domain-containing protein